MLGEHLEGDRKVVRFADTISMSTYLLAFVVGTQATKPSLGRTPLRVWYVPDTPDKRQARRRADCASSRSSSLRYYGQPYPGGKLDLLAVPNFAAGAMENFARSCLESALLVDERQARVVWNCRTWPIPWRMRTRTCGLEIW